jgi:pyruvate kinase
MLNIKFHYCKIEMPEALENMDKIVAYCDALMVARGDQV